MTTEDTIKLSLFDLLDKVESLKDYDFSEKEGVLVLHKIETYLEEFLENFLLQFFRNGYAIDIDGVNDSSLREIEKHFRLHRFWFDSPKKMVKIFEEAIEAKYDLEVAVYLSPPRDEDLIEVYRMFIPNMLRIFKKEGRKIRNYLQVVSRIEKTFELMGLPSEKESAKQTKL